MWPLGGDEIEVVVKGESKEMAHKPQTCTLCRKIITVLGSGREVLASVSSQDIIAKDGISVLITDDEPEDC